MPSASKPDIKAGSEATDHLKQVLQVVEKKVRNLEKRKGKLDQYRQKSEEGEELNKDQKDAIGKYDAVINNLEFARELQKQFISIGNDAEKQLKKQARRDKLERHSAETRRMHEVLELQVLLEAMGADTARQDFKVGRNGAVQVSEAQLEQLDKFYKVVSPSRDEEPSFAEQLNSASEHLVSFMEARDKEVAGTTYKELKDLTQKIHDCRYFDTKRKAEEKSEEIDEEKKDEGTEKAEHSEDTEDDEPVRAVEPTPATAASAATTTDEKTISRHTPAASGAAPGVTVVPGPASSGVAASAAVVAALEADSSVSTQLPSPQQPTALEATSLSGLSQTAQAIGDPTAATMGTASQNLPGLAPGFQAQDDSFFTTTPFAAGQRAFTEIVSSVQGTFNFLQDSHIESSNSPHMDPAVVAAQPMAMPSIGQTASGTEYSAAPGLMSSTTDRQSQSTSQSDSTQQLESTYSTGLDYGQQSQLSSLQSAHPTFGSDAPSLTGGHQMSGLEQDISSTPDVPPQIPLPNQTSMSADSQISPDSQEKKHYSMNPNAVTFHSMYNQQAAGGTQNSEYSQQQAPPPSQQQQQQTQSQPQSHSSSSGMGDNNSKYNNKYNDYQSSTTFENSSYGQSSQSSSGYSSGYRGRDGSRGGPRGGGTGRGGRGSSGPPGMSNGYNQRGGGRSSGPPYNSSRGGYNGGGRGSSRGGYQGYPPRSDYQPEGGYQGYSNGFTGTSGPSASGAGSGFGGKRGGGGAGASGAPHRGPMRGGPAATGGMGRGGPRGGMRGGSRGGYGGQRSGPPQ